MLDSYVVKIVVGICFLKADFSVLELNLSGP